MASDQVLVHVTFREIPLFQSAVLQAVSAKGAFLHTESPMPVGTMLILSPERAPEVKVAATVGLVVEACRGVKLPAGEQPGMNLVFEAGGERMLDHLEDLAASVAPPAEVAPAPAPIAPLAVLAPRRDPSPQPAEPPNFEEIPTKVERQFVVSAPSEEPPALQPFASGSMTVEAAPPPRVSDEPSVIVEEEPAEPPGAEGDPDGPDKVVVELEADYTGDGEDEGEGGSEGEGGEGEGDDAKKKKKRSRSRRRKKR